MKEYYSKTRGLIFTINELIVSKLSKEVGLISPKIKIVKDDIDQGFYRVLSYNLENLGNFITADKILNKEYLQMPYISLYDIWYSLEDKYLDIVNLMLEVIKMYLFDFFISYSDRHCSNWGILTINNENHIAIIDNELSFDNISYSMITSSLDVKEYFNKIYRTRDIENLKKNQEEIRNFLNQSSLKFVDVLNEFLTILTPSQFIKVLNDIEENEYILVNGESKQKIKIPSKEILIEIYTNRYNMMLDLYNELNLKNKR